MLRDIFLHVQVTEIIQEEDEIDAVYDLHVQVTEIIQEEDEIDAVYDMRSQLCAWKENPKEFWNFKKISSKKAGSGIPDRLSDINNISYSTSATIVQAFQDFFQSSYGASSSSIRPPLRQVDNNLIAKPVLQVQLRSFFVLYQATTTPSRQ
ncbi:hypothetical protein QE152_g3992 [Popillia japonica]|uniref:Uncharacterized protein n=1 Tax=Popillia japonica TaxID=7064 RepID=A0AAW1N1N2_POPJA